MMKVFLASILIFTATLTVLVIEKNVQAQEPSAMTDEQRYSPNDAEVVAAKRAQLAELELMVNADAFKADLIDGVLTPSERDRRLELVDETNKLRLEILNMEFSRFGERLGRY